VPGFLQKSGERIEPVDTSCDELQLPADRRLFDGRIPKGDDPLTMTGLWMPAVFDESGCDLESSAEFFLASDLGRRSDSSSSTPSR